MLLLRLFLGFVFTILGVIGSVLPVLQGWIFFLLAVFVLFPRSRVTVRIVERIETKAPRIVRGLRRMGIGVS